MKKLILFFVIQLFNFNYAQIKDSAKVKEKNIDEVIIVASSRTQQKIENSPQKIEILGKEEMQEESGIKPAGIASILGDISGVQIQQTSAISGNSNVRIQGLDGRYTQILKDGMPLFDGFSGGLGVLNIPPLDLQQVELIKGSASTLYGGGAIGGLVNIISRKPTTKQELTALANYSTLSEKNLNLYASKKYNFLGYTFFAGYTSQNAKDINKDGFSDVPEINSVVVHPKLFLYPSSNSTISLGWSGTFDKNLGGDMQVINGNSNVNHQYFEQNKTKRNSYELIFEQKFNDNSKLSLKNSISNFDRNFLSNNNLLKAKQTNYFSELSYIKNIQKSTLVIGTDVQGSKFSPKDYQFFQVPQFENNSFGIFIQNSIKFNNTNIEAGIRQDFTNNYGNFFLPQIAVIHHFNERWAARAGIGLGYKVPNALSPSVYDYPIENILPIDIQNTIAEKSVGYNAEFNYKKKFGNDNEIFINQAFFLTQINHPITGNINSEGNIYFKNENKPVISKGFDTYIKATLDEWELYLGYTFTIAENKFLEKNQFIPLTPKHRFAMTALKEFNTWKAGIEASYTGKQHRLDYTFTPSYLFMAAMISKDVGKHFTLVLNCENLLDYRQSKKESLYFGSISNPTFYPLWSPIDGRVINLSVKWKL
jgi:iron complex outermembrane receptor protein/outer membrane receptor for ferrienterochelin and colicins